MSEVRPVRLQLSRRKGFDLQAWSREVNGLGAVNCARPGEFGNPYVIGEPSHATNRRPVHDATEVVALFRSDLTRSLLQNDFALDNLLTLRAHNLAYWCHLCAKHAATGKPLDEACPDCAPCHVDVLGELANPKLCESP